ncbi:MAG: hypothetical protein FD129_2826 [bacterium]|nr:MAG: hypothetical protein FD129_2826 [bacterium]
MTPTIFITSASRSATWSVPLSSYESMVRPIGSSRPKSLVASRRVTTTDVQAAPASESSSQRPLTTEKRRTDARPGVTSDTMNWTMAPSFRFIPRRLMLPE